jgi:two-component system, OmpR family, sensor kinase
MTQVFAEARRRLALRYVVLFALVLTAFSTVFFVAIAIVIQPAFDIGPEPPEGAPATRAYTRTIERIGLVVIVADVAVVSGVAFVAWYLAERTLRPVRDAHERQGRFVADASHEIRSPLAVIRSTVDQALSPAANDQTRTDALVTIGDAVDRLTATTRGLLTLAALERPLGATRDPIDVSVAVAEAVATARAAEPSPGTTIELNLAPDLLVRGDSDALTGLVRNLIDNALRYASGRPIGVRASGTPGSAIVEVTDHGPGIAPADLERVFEPFYRVRADSKAPPGTGLGLAIAARLARELGGRLQAESKVGEGSVFRVTLPREH